MFKETHPILGTLDIQRAIAFYTQQLGFKLAFGDKADPPNYVGFRRDAVELHMQFQFEHEMGKPRRHKKNPKTTYALGALNREVRVLPDHAVLRKWRFPCSPGRATRTWLRHICALDLIDLWLISIWLSAED
jgi:catechol 2,3-dioxygenase-like lactoylglutathione lyase family enzyme